MDRRRLTALAAILFGAAIIAPGVLASAAPVYPSLRRTIDNSLTIGHLFRIDSLNPFIGFSNEAYIFYSLVYDYLFSVDEDQQYRPNIATSASSPDGGRTWVYQIRQGVRWHDGTDLTASDVAFTINYNIQNFWLLWAYEPYVETIKQCPTPQSPECGAKQTGDWEVTVYFSEPFAPGGSALLVPILQEKQWRGISAQEAQYSFTNPNPIGTGPYMADSNIHQAWLNGDPIVLHANPNYHFGRPRVDRIVFQLFNDENSMVAALLSGEIDVAMLSASGYEAIQTAAPRYPLIAFQEGLTVIQYWIDIGIIQLNDPGINAALNSARFDINVRQAMAHATDKQFILDQFYRGKGVVGSTLVSPVQPFWHYEPTPSETFAYSLDAANQILDQAGYDARAPDGIRKASRDIIARDVCDPVHATTCASRNVTIPAGTELRFRMVVRQEAAEERQIAAYLKANWRQIGIDITYDVVEEAAMTNIVYGAEVETYIWWWSADVDPNYILSIQSEFALNGWSDNYYDNRTYNELYIDHLAAMDPVQRQQYARQAQRVHYNSAPFIILVYPFFHYAWWTDEFTGWGDMSAHPGRQIGAFFGAHPLFLDLEPLSGGNAFPIAGPTLIAIGAGAAATAASVIAYIVLREKRRRAEEELPRLPPIPPPPRP